MDSDKSGSIGQSSRCNKCTMLFSALKSPHPSVQVPAKRPVVRPVASLPVPRLQGVTDVTGNFNALSPPCLPDVMNEIRPDSKIVLYSVNKSVNLWSEYALKMSINGA